MRELTKYKKLTVENSKEIVIRQKTVRDWKRKLSDEAAPEL